MKERAREWRDRIIIGSSMIAGAIIGPWLAHSTAMSDDAKAAEMRSKIRYVHEALKRAEGPDDQFVNQGREDVRSLGLALLECWKVKP